MKKHNEKFNKEIENIRKYQTEVMKLKNTMVELKKYADGFNSRLKEAEERISKLGEKAMELTQTEQKKGKRILKSEDTLRDLYDNIKQNNIHITVSRRGRERERGRKFI